MDYPVRLAEDWKRIGRLPLTKKVSVFLRDRRLTRRAQAENASDLTLVRGIDRKLPPEAVVLLCVCRNAVRYLPSILKHYRELGIERFAFVDDNSDDGTSELLLEQPDVDLFGSAMGFKQSMGGLYWRDRLLQHYGRDRWYVSIDSDEYLVYPGYETRPLAAFIAELEKEGSKRVHAVMLDLYPDGKLGEPRGARGALDAFPTATSPLFDAGGYQMAEERFGTAVRGGPRFRLYGTDMRISKFPLLYADKNTFFASGSHHGPLPLRRNFAPVRAVLLHHKFDECAVEGFREAAERSSHVGGSRFYKEIVERDDFGPDTDLRYEGSAFVDGSETLVRKGFMLDRRSR